MSGRRAAAREAAQRAWRALFGFRHGRSGTLFFALLGFHLLLKASLGLFLTVDGGYGLSAVTPPATLLVAGTDVLVLFALVKLLDLLLPAAALRALYPALLAADLLYLAAAHVLYFYFRTFLSYGLIRFNGADAVELASYVPAALTRWFWLFFLPSLALLALALRRPEGAERWRRPGATAATLAAGLAAVALHRGLMRHEFTGNLYGNPEYVVAGTTLRHLLATPRVEAGDFVPPRGPLSGEAPPATGPLPRPDCSGYNVIVLVLESFSLAETGPAPAFPAFERLRGRALVLANHRTVFPSTTRSLVSLLCSSHGNTAPASITNYLPDFRCASLMEVLRGQGYRTGFFTPTIREYDNFGRAGFMRHFDEVQDYPALRGSSRLAGPRLARLVEAEVAYGRLAEFAARGGAPFFALAIGYWTHAPYELPFEDVRALPPLERYRRTLAYESRALEALLDRLERAGVADRTVLVLTGDHGEGFGVHPENVGHSNYLYEESVRVPTLVWIPSRLEREVVERRPSTHADLMPTLLSLLRVPAPADLQGQSLVDPGWEPRPQPLFSRSHHAFNGLVDGRLKYFHEPGGAEYLFDLAADPGETRNLAAARPQLAAAYAAAADRWALWQERFITRR